MSADNGIYILATPGQGLVRTEYRTAYQMAVENVYWDDGKDEETNDPDVWIENARKMWGSAPVFTTRAQALIHADNQAQGYPVLEYGISFIHIPRTF